MDVLADALKAMRTARPRSARAEVRAPWGLRFPAFTGTTFHVVLHGSCWLLDGKPGEPGEPGEGRHLRLGPGDVVFLRRATEHVLADDPASPVRAFEPEEVGTDSLGRLRLDGPGEATVLLCGAYLLDGERPHPLLAELPGVLHLPAGAHGRLGRLVDLLGQEFDDPQPGSDGVVPALVDAMLLYILRAWIAGRRDVPGGWAAALTDPAISAALRDIHSEPERPWTVAALAARSAMSRTVFAQRFTELVGRPPLTYLTWWRMTVAARLLRESGAPLAVVARQVGYVSPYAFARAFRREYGISPGRYRHARS
ncbi:AraC family transcriptional regulator [Microbispora sp. NPDC046973]|uniref:AraC family transcriptional regulator n=1 Tax=Microbispora sp. NPDC046973 TaxID=3155022 RepID=UPI0033F21609